MFSENSKIIVSFVTLMSCLPIQVVKIVVAETFMQQLMHLIDRLSANWPCEKECHFLTLFFAKSDGFNLPWPLRFFLSKPLMWL